MGNGKSRRQAQAVLAVLAASVVVGACGGGGGGADDGASLSDLQSYQPLVDNSRWIYSDTGSHELTVVSVVGTQAVGSNTGAVIESASAAGNVEREVLVPASDGIRHYASAGADAMDRGLDGMLLLRAQARTGDSWVQVDRAFDSGDDFDGDGHTDTVSLHAETAAIGLERVDTPAGTFEACLHQRQKIRETIQLSASGQTSQVDFTIDTWYAAGVGAVKTSTQVESPYVNSTSTQLLIAYRVGSRQSDTTAPTLRATSPGDTTSGTAAVVSADFSKAMDPASFGPGTFRVFNSAHVEMPGSAQVEGSIVRFAPSWSWQADTYTAVISAGAQDLLGHPVGTELRWSFTIDTTGPGIVRTSPANDTAEVPLDSPIVLEFSEPVAATSVNAHTVWLNGNGQAVPFTLSVDGARVTVTPTAPLVHGATYQLSVYDVTDTSGNLMPEAFEMQFHTDQAPFAWPGPLVPDGNATTVAIGDVNGDGIPDVLTYGVADTMSPGGLVLRTGRPDGTLGMANLLSTGDDFSCVIGAIEIGDVNGDGRNDVVIDEGVCGIRVLHQNTAGSLEPAELQTIGGTTRVRLADLDGDGRFELLAATASGVDIWKADATGTLVPKATLSIGPPSAKEIEVGDVNGDGRPDIVLALSNGTGQEVAVLLQQPDGSFANPMTFSAGAASGAAALAIGDFNGDGRQDIAVVSGNNSSPLIAIFFQGADGTLGPAVSLATDASPIGLRAADVNGDGRTDLVVSHVSQHGVGIYLQRTDGTMAPEQLFTANRTGDQRSLAVGDVTRDGKPDIILAGSLLVQKPAGISGTSSVLRGRMPLRAILGLPQREAMRR